MKLIELKGVAYSTRDRILHTMVYDAKPPYKLYESGCTVDYAIEVYGEKELKKIDVENDFLVLEIEMED